MGIHLDTGVIITAIIFTGNTGTGKYGYGSKGKEYYSRENGN